MQFTITLPDADVQELGKSEAEIRMDLAVFLYLAWKIPAGRCAEYAGVPKVVFLNELGRRALPINYDLNALEQDQENWATYIAGHDRHQRHYMS